MAAQLRPTRPRAELAAEEAAVALAWVRRRCPGAVDESTSLRAALRSGVVLGRLADALGLGDCAWRAVDERALGATTAAGSVARRAKFPTSKAPISAVFHSFRLIFGRAIISRNGLEAWMHFPERARAKHSR